MTAAITQAGPHEPSAELTGRLEGHDGGAGSRRRSPVVVEPLLLRPGQAADVLSISRTKVYELLKSGELPSVTIGGSIRVPMAGLRRWVAERSQNQN